MKRVIILLLILAILMLSYILSKNNEKFNNRYEIDRPRVSNRPLVRPKSLPRIRPRNEGLTRLGGGRSAHRPVVRRQPGRFSGPSQPPLVFTPPPPTTSPIMGLPRISMPQLGGPQLRGPQMGGPPPGGGRFVPPQ